MHSQGGPWVVSRDRIGRYGTTKRSAFRRAAFPAMDARMATRPAPDRAIRA
jgi:hypothetical protein